jgi:alkaline phosphatase D
LDEPADSIRRKRDGLYESYYVISEKHIKVILLDVRFFKNSTSQTILGEAQWKWLEEEIKNSQAEYTLIGSGIQVLPDDRTITEMWYDSEREKLIGLIRKYALSGVILLSGDVHFAEVMKYPCRHRVGYELHEFTSSGLTHYAGTHIPYFGPGFAKHAVPDTFSTSNDRYIERNFGALRFTFGKTGGVTYEIKNFTGHTVLMKYVSQKELHFDNKYLDLEKSCITDKNAFLRALEKFGKLILILEPYPFVVIGTVFFVFYLLSRLFKLCCCCKGKQTSREKSVQDENKSKRD